MTSNGAQVKQRELDVWELRQRGWTQQRVADHLGISRSYVARIEGRLSSRISNHLEEEARRELGTQVDQLCYIVDEALQSWEQSKGTERIVTQKKNVVTGQQENADGIAEVTTRVRDIIGDPRFLATAMQAMGDLRALLQMETLLVKLEVDWREVLPSDVDPASIDDLVNEFAEYMLAERE